jgi:hypothetical protein
VLLVLHVDEVDDDDAAEVAQPQLPRNHLRGFDVGAEHGLLEAGDAEEPAGVHVDGRHRLGLLDDQIAAALERHRGQARSLAAERILDHLHHHRLPFTDHIADVAAVIAADLDTVGIQRHQVTEVQKTGAVEPDVDEGRLHPGKHAHHTTQVDVSHQALVATPLDVDLVQHAPFDDSNARLHRRGVDQYLFTHGMAHALSSH